ncbi:cation:proton antiporter family protein [Methylocaldum sp.]|uniref:cation:proton antiporter family protein n=1 Tax=Methylocaldum sp. TaxID=1969727 RepID=UPI002D719795|nr:cation:proton antiporter family protein [Methylocaldum sp.]HYE34115.1 cation:proton antiporter family protein [Methylocaldum sp.]
MPMVSELSLIASAYLAGLVASHLRLPPLVGYLGAGYALSYFGIPANGVISQIAELGIELLLFTVGLKLRLTGLIGREILGVGGLHILLVAGATGLGFLLLDRQITGGLLLGTSLAFSSTVLAVKVLEDNGELSTLHGRITLGILILQDIVAVGLLALADNHQQPTLWASLLLLFPFFRPLAFYLFKISGTDELRLLLGLLLALAGGAMADTMGVSADLGALWMGSLLAGHPDAKALSDKLWGLKESFLVAFFLAIGLAGVPTSEEFLWALRLIALLPLKGLLFFLLFIVVGLRARTAFISSLALTTYSEFALITSQVIAEAGLLSAEWITIMGVAVAFSLALAAPLNLFSHRLFAHLEPMLVKLERGRRHPDRTPTSIGIAEWLILGMGRTGSAAYRTLESQGYPVVGLDADPSRVEAQRDQGRRVLYGDAEDPELWEGLHTAGLKGIILAMPEFEARHAAVKYLRSRGFRGVIGTTSFRSNEDPLLSEAGANVIFHPMTEAGERLAQRMLEALGTPKPTLYRAAESTKNLETRTSS